MAPMTPALRNSSSALKPESITVLKRWSRMARSLIVQKSTSWISAMSIREMPEPEVRMLERAHHAVVGVVEHRREARQAVLAEIGRRFLAGLHGVHDAADLGREHVVVARLLAQRRAHAQFAAAVAVERRGVEVADARRRRRASVSATASASEIVARKPPIGAPPRPSVVTSSLVLPTLRRLSVVIGLSWREFGQKTGSSIE